MKKIKKYVVMFLAIIAILFITKTILIKTDIWYYKLVDDYYLIGQGNGSYSLKNSFFSFGLVKDIDRNSRWMISTKGIYGYVNLDKLFYLDRNSDSVHFFHDGRSLHKYLEEHNEKSYDESSAEGLVHLKMGKDRVYKK